MDLFVLVPLVHLAAVTVPLAVTDAREHRLPNALVVPGLVLLAWAVAGVGMRDPIAAVAPLVAGGITALVFGAGWALGGVGMGDVKLALLLAGVAGMTDARILLPAGVTAAVLAGASVATRLVAGEVPVRWLRVPLGPALLAGFWAVLAEVQFR